jgi:hypothetical protein
MTGARNPWIELPTSAPYVVDSDRKLIELFNATAKPEHVVHLEHHPEPFLGNPDAPVVLLCLNPGYSSDCDRWYGDPVFANRARASLVHEPSPYPFHLLDPSQPAPGHHWWSRKLRPLINATSLQAVARGVLCVEFFPYHSERFGHTKLRVPSQEYSFDLVRRAIARDAWIVFMRSERLWFSVVPELASYRRLMRTRSVQNPVISPRNVEGEFDDLVGAVGNVWP